MSDIIAKLGLGCWAFGEDWYWGKQSHSDSVKTIQAALRGGIKHFDTARSYSNGRSEQITG
ncbi:MAG: aldo/keto reductase, partial [Spirochaetota bacterium]|nr:aldo/keto reductase [Spirochaetota bacterium]